MTIRMHHLLAQWHPQRDHCEWVLGTIVRTERSAYRKAGAMMLFGELGQRLGMLSGGCLEDNLAREAHKALSLKRSLWVSYDLEIDEQEPSNWRNAIGCGGAVTVMLQCVSAQNAYLGLDKIHLHLQSQTPLVYRQAIDAAEQLDPAWEIDTPAQQTPRNHCRTIDRGTSSWLETSISPAPQLLIIGGGLDAVPLAALANNIGWQVSVVDERTRCAQHESFPSAQILPQSIASLRDNPPPQAPDAIVIMTHNLSLDAQALRYASQSPARYVGLLGPEHRRRKVEHIASVSAEDFSGVYRGPVGLEIGAKLPETIALAILAECHQFIEGDRQHSVALSLPDKSLY